MFGMGGTEIIVILVVALLFLGPDKLPQAAKTISKGIRDIKKQSRALQNQIEGDEQIGGAIRDLKSALRGDDAPAPRPKVPKPKKQLADVANAPPAPLDGADPAHAALLIAPGVDAGEPAVPTEAEPAPALTMPLTAGEPDPDSPNDADDDDLASMIRPAEGTVAKGSEPGHG